MLGLRAICEGPISALLPGQLFGEQTITQRFASHSFATRSTDTPAHTFIAGRINSGLTLGRQIEQADGGQFGSLIISAFGEILLNNTDGALDSLVDDFFIDGREIKLKIGATEIDSSGREKVQPFADFATVYTTIAGAWSAENDVLRLRIRDQRINIQGRLQTTTYAGTGGQQGTADMAGRTLPTCFGHVLNAPGQMVDPSLLIGQLHDGPMEAVDDLYDQGVSIPADTTPDYADYAALAAATITAGKFATCLAAGYYRLGTSPTGIVTADVKGDNAGGSPSDYVNTHAGIIKRILLRSLVADDLDDDTFTALDADQGAEIGIFFPAGDQSTVEEAVQRVAFSAGALAGQDRSGLYRVQRLDPPVSAATWLFSDREIISIEREALPYGVPWSGWGVGYQKNWMVQRGGDLASGVTQARRRFLEAEYRYKFATTANVSLAHATSIGAPLREGLYLDSDDAMEEATRLAAFYSLSRALYRVVVKNVLFSLEIGQTVKLTYPRWNLTQGKNFVVVSISDDADAVETTFRAFG